MHEMGKTTRVLHIAIMHDRILKYARDPMMTAQKRHVRVTLDIICYDDLDVHNMNWRELLELEGDEEVDPTIREIDPF